MGKKDDLKQVDSIAREFRMSAELRKEFGSFLEQEKKLGHGGTFLTGGQDS
ncbi:MAG: hypothetical protein HEQ10_09600 [Dolichospermum sp. DEX182a]|nr:hypothetical protein [Dolichospermum sp. DEX182a]QSV64713.1 MAG: hypothetical protein HEQ26_20160 [Dolichospermum sp. DL01]